MKENLSVVELQNTCIDLKKHVIDMIWKAQSGHPGTRPIPAGKTATASSSPKVTSAPPSMRRWP